MNCYVKNVTSNLKKQGLILSTKLDLEGEVNMYDRNIIILIYYTKTRCCEEGGGVHVRTRGVVAVHELLVDPVGYKRYNIRSSPALFCQPDFLLLTTLLNNRKRMCKSPCPCLRRRNVSRWELIDIEQVLKIRCT